MKTVRVELYQEWVFDEERYKWVSDMGWHWDGEFYLSDTEFQAKIIDDTDKHGNPTRAHTFTQIE